MFSRQPRGSLWIGVLAVLVAGSAQAVGPTLSSITPCGGQRGTEVEVQLGGARLEDAKELFLYAPGIAVKDLRFDANLVRATLALAPDCGLGPHDVRLRTASGISNLITFSVGALPEAQEAEPNNDFAVPQPVQLDTTICGVVQNEDVDYFAVEAKKGERITAEVEGLRIGRTFFDPAVAILDARRFVLASADDTPLVWQDAVCSVVAPQDGKYVVEVRESAYGGNGNCVYRLHVGRFPRPLAVYPAGGKPGEAIQLQWLGDAAGPWTETVSLPGDASSTYRLFGTDGQGIAPWPNIFRLVDLDNVLEVEPNNAPDQATPLGVPGAANGVIAEPGDVDHFKFSAKKDQVFDVRVHGRALRSPLDPVLGIRRSGGADAGSNDDSGGPDSYLRFRVPADDDYVLAVRDHLNMGGSHYVYRVEITPVEPKLTVELAERSAYVDTTIPVPKGNRVAVMVNALRADFGGEVALEIRGTPPGVSVESLPIPDGQTSVPVLFTATAEAEIAGSLAEMIGRSKVGELAIEGRLRQRSSLVRGQNNREVWSRYTDRAAVAVVDAVPYSIEIVQPKAPIVRSGAMQLKIVAKRDEGFDAPISIRMLYNPPGVGSSGTVAIPQGQSEAVLPLTANAGAQLGTWKIAVTGETAIGGGTVLVTSQLADLRVEEPFFKFTIPTVSLEQGQKTELAVVIEQTREFDGAAQVELIGLPPQVTSENRQFDKAAAEVVFPIQADAASPPGQHKSLLCRATVTVDNEPVQYTQGTGEMRIFRPPPPKAEPAAEPKPAPEPEPTPNEPAPKRLSRLEQLRLDRAVKQENK